MGKKDFKNWNILLNSHLLKRGMLALASFSLMVSCCLRSHMNSHREANDNMRVESIRKRQDAIAHEIVSLHYSFISALSLVSNTNAVEFSTIARPLSNRLREVSKELDALGPFPLCLRESTLKAMDDDAQLIVKKGRGKSSNPWTTEAASIITDRKSTRLNSSHTDISRMPSSA